MSRVDDFLLRIGLDLNARRWLRHNVGDPLREEIILALSAAMADGCAPAHVETLRTLLARIRVRA